VFRVIPNRATAIQALRAGEIQFSQIEAPPAEVPGLKATAGLSVQSVKLQEKIWLGLNLRDPILAKADVRKAMAMAINQKDINSRVYKDLGITAVGPCLSYSEYCDPSLPMPKYDPAGANALLDQAGYPKKSNGMRFSITLSAWSVSEYGIAEMAQVVKQELAEVGIDLQVKMADFSLFSQQVVKDHNFQITTSGGLWGPDPSALEAFYSSTGGRNVMGFNDSEVDSLLQQARVESDPSKRKELYFDAEKRVTEALPIIPLIDYVGLYPVRTDTHGYWWEPEAAKAGIAEMMYNYVWMDSGTAQPAPTK
jgi:peptide/nickel transport system substrate-binding protein